MSDRPDPPDHLEPPSPPERVTGPPARGRVLVLAPHPDDETIGPGGTVLLHADAGDEVHALFLTAGAAGDPTGAEDPAAYAVVRQEEARAAASVLGIGSLDFWGLPDHHRVHENDLSLLVPKMQKALASVAPDVVYAPHAADQHSDHHATAVILQRALAECGATPAVFGYEVWSAGPARWVVDVSASYDRKLEALRCYPSQLAFTDIERFITGLNSYRAVFLEKDARYGEAFSPLEADASAGRS